MDENDVNITAHKRDIDAIRAERQAKDGGSDQNGSGRYTGHRETSTSRDTSRVAQRTGAPGREDQGVGPPDRPAQEYGERVRPVDRPGINTTKGTSNTGAKTRGQGNDPLPVTPDKRFSFNLRSAIPGMGPKEPVKLFTKQESEDSHDKMYDVYYHGSSILDDILEIVVKDHEPVQIWQLDENEADMLATMHLERAQHDEQAARSARKLVEIYDRLYIYILAYPRLKLTGAHIKEHGGFSFR